MSRPRLKLSLDSLQVESFDPVAFEPDQRGTVKGAEYGTRETYQPCASCAPTCNLYGYCSFDDYTCNTCNNCPSAGGTCACGTADCGSADCAPWTEGYTCVNTCGAYSCICSAFCNSIDLCETEAECY